MSKYVKNLITQDLQQRLAGVQDALLVNVAGMSANATYRLRKELRSKQIHLLVIKNSLARRAAEGTPLAAMFANLSGPAAVVFGAEDIVSLAKEVTRLSQDKTLAPFGSRGGVLDGAALSAEQVADVSRWPSREEQLSLLVGQILGPGATLAAQLIGPGGALASQVKQRGEESTESSAESPAEANA